MSNDFFFNLAKRHLIGIILLLISLITLYPFFDIGFASADDWFYYTLSFQDHLWQQSFEFAKGNGRFYFALVNPFYTFPYLFDNFIVTKSIQFLFLLLSFYLFSVVLKKITRSYEFSILFCVLLLATISLSNLSNVIVFYPFYFTFSFSIILCSVLLLLAYFENKKQKFLIWSSIVYFIGLIFYETYLIYLLIISLLILCNRIKEEKTNLRSFKYTLFLKELLPFIVVGVSYLIIYISFYLIYPSGYSGNSVASELKMENIFLVLSNYAASAFPIAVYEQNQSVFYEKSELLTGHTKIVLDLIASARVEWIVKAVLICTLFCFLIRRIPKISTLTFSFGLVVSFILIYFSHLFLSVSQKYGVEYSYMKGYVTTYFSFFGVTLFLTILFHFLYKLVLKNRILKTIYFCVCLFLLFAGSILTSYSNYYTAKDMSQSKLAFDVMENFCKWDKFTTTPENAIIYAEDLWETSSTQIHLNGQGFDWKDFVFDKTHRNFNTIRYYKDFYESVEANPTCPTYYLSRSEANKTKEAVLVFSKIDSSSLKKDGFGYISNEAYIFYYSTYKEFSVTLSMKNNCTNGNKIQIDSWTDTVQENYYSFNIKNNNRSKEMTSFKISAPNVDLNSITISNIKIKNRPTVEVW